MAEFGAIWSAIPLWETGLLSFVRGQGVFHLKEIKGAGLYNGQLNVIWFF
jgi:hypothetical protein